PTHAHTPTQSPLPLLNQLHVYTQFSSRPSLDALFPWTIPSTVWTINMCVCVCEFVNKGENRPLCRLCMCVCLCVVVLLGSPISILFFLTRPQSPSIVN